MPAHRNDDFDEDIADDHGLDDDLFEDDDGVDAFDTVECPACGRLVADEAQWCPHCGQWIVRRPAQAGRRQILYLLIVLALLPGLIILATC